MHGRKKEIRETIHIILLSLGVYTQILLVVFFLTRVHQNCQLTTGVRGSFPSQGGTNGRPVTQSTSTNLRRALTVRKAARTAKQKKSVISCSELSSTCVNTVLCRVWAVLPIKQQPDVSILTGIQSLILFEKKRELKALLLSSLSTNCVCVLKIHLP